MSNLFSTDGILYKACTVIYHLLLLNLLWFVFSLPVITTGASTTALFFVTGKIMRRESHSISREFWKSFKLNFKQATIIFIMLMAVFFVVFTNITNIEAFGSLSIVVYPVNIILLVLIIAIFIYIFPLLSRYHLKTKDCFKLAVYLTFRHFMTTILCLAVVPGIYILLSWNGGFYSIAMSIYSFWIYYFIKDKLDNLQNKF